MFFINMYPYQLIVYKAYIVKEIELLEISRIHWHYRIFRYNILRMFVLHKNDYITISIEN